ncbi:hypothetical protein [Flaviflexus equikiangi]|uniref:Uncharacterized protein n=1 Tax=Flaviflexus equikiangi TaxID=2758573 RepID=A0ABS2TCK1_9ACTO|nr:hypothetical protein [Flaviflexus equikiangi]MBM9432369.1 hypothetical protein [Flaviflexus equikiangi]
MYLTDLEFDLVRAIRAWQHNPSKDNFRAVHAAFFKAAPLAKATIGRVRPRGRHARTTS